MKNINTWLFLILPCFFLYACATTLNTFPPEKGRKIQQPEEVIETASLSERESKSLEVFFEILELVSSSADRQSVLPRIEELYERIIREYPDTPLAQESYWKLITIYIEDYSPPGFEKAETRYSEFISRYPESILRSIVADALGKSYYRNSEWSRLLELCAPAFRDYIDKGQNPKASLLFMYSEANYHLGNLSDAEKGYKIVSELFPGLQEGVKSKAMLEKTGKIKE